VTDENPPFAVLPLIKSPCPISIGKMTTAVLNTPEMSKIQSNNLRSEQLLTVPPCQKIDTLAKNSNFYFFFETCNKIAKNVMTSHQS
jgi:hypothetical protein